MVRFKMVGKDLNSNPLQYRTWVVDNQPDYDGYYYDGPKSGNTPLGQVTGYVITDDNLVVDFNLPNPLSWQETQITMPEAMSSSQLAVIDGYIYLFGGNDGYGNKILRSTVNNPTIWEDTEETLPNNLYGSQLAVIDDVIYLFGGNDGYATSHIYSAPTSDPLDWTDEGSLLPEEIYNSQLFLKDGYVYLFGGYNGSTTYTSILRATTSNPLSWTTIGSLPEGVYGSILGVVNGPTDGYVCLFGGIKSDNSQTNNIYAAPLSNLTSWSVMGTLPYPISYGQFLNVGTFAFLLTSTNSSTSFTSVLRCSLSTPFSWSDFGFKVPGTITQSQLAIIDDRLFLFGGNGNSAIFADYPYIKYSTTDAVAIAYGTATRTQFNSYGFDNAFKVIGIAPWKTTY